MDPLSFEQSSGKSGSLFDSHAAEVGTVEGSAPKIWTRPARLFIVCVSLFVFSTVALLIALEVLNVAVTFSNQILLPQSIGSELFLLGAAILAVRSQNMVQIFSVVLFNIFLVICGFVEAQQQHATLLDRIRSDRYASDPWSRFEGSISRARLASIWTLPVVDLLFHVGCDWAAWKLYRELGWDAYKKVAGDLHLSRLYFNYQLLCSSLVFTTYFSMVQTWSFCYIAINTFDVGITNRVPFVAVFVVAWIIYASGIFLAHLAIKTERILLLRFSWALQVVYLCWNIYVIRQFIRGAPENFPRISDADLVPGKALFQFVVGFPLAIFTLAYTYIVSRGFGEGLKAVHSHPIVLDPEKVELSLD